MKFEVKNIKKRYGKKETLKDVSFCAESGKCIGILGKNGSGKSTLLSILAGVRKCDSGECLWDGKDILKDSKARSGVVGYVPQGTPLFEELSAYDNLSLWYGRRELKRELESGVLRALGVHEFLSVPVNKMSGGMKKRLSIGCSIAKKPPVLLLDEPGAALDLVCKESIADYLTQYKNAGGILIITTHDQGELSLCDEYYILRDGELEPFDYNGDIHRLAVELGK